MSIRWKRCWPNCHLLVPPQQPHLSRHRTWRFTHSRSNAGCPCWVGSGRVHRRPRAWSQMASAEGDDWTQM